MSFLWEDVRNRMELSTENGLLKSRGRGMKSQVNQSNLKSLPTDLNKTKVEHLHFLA